MIGMQALHGRKYKITCQLEKPLLKLRPFMFALYPLGKPILNNLSCSVMLPCLQGESQIRYHIVLGEKLLKNNLHNGMHRETMLGFSYQVGVFLRDGQVLLFALGWRNSFPAIYEASFNFKLICSQKELFTSSFSSWDVIAQTLSLKCLSQTCLIPRHP